MNQVEKKIMSVALFALAASSLLYASDSSAQVSGFVYVKNDATGLCLQNYGGPVSTRKCVLLQHMMWRVTKPDSALVIKSLMNDHCLDSNAQGNVYAIACNGGAHQQWFEVLKSNGRRMIVNVATGRCLDSNAQGQAYTLPCNGGRYQLWYYD